MSSVLKYTVHSHSPHTSAQQENIGLAILIQWLNSKCHQVSSHHLTFLSTEELDKNGWHLNSHTVSDICGTWTLAMIKISSWETRSAFWVLAQQCFSLLLWCWGLGPGPHVREARMWASAPVNCSQPHCRDNLMRHQNTEPLTTVSKGMAPECWEHPSLC